MTVLLEYLDLFSHVMFALFQCYIRTIFTLLYTQIYDLFLRIVQSFQYIPLYFPPLIIPEIILA